MRSNWKSFCSIHEWLTSMRCAADKTNSWLISQFGRLDDAVSRCLMDEWVWTSRMRGTEKVDGALELGRFGLGWGFDLGSAGKWMEDVKLECLGRWPMRPENEDENDRSLSMQRHAPIVFHCCRQKEKKRWRIEWTNLVDFERFIYLTFVGFEVQTLNVVKASREFEFILNKNLPVAKTLSSNFTAVYRWRCHRSEDENESRKHSPSKWVIKKSTINNCPARLTRLNSSARRMHW